MSVLWPVFALFLTLAHGIEVEPKVGSNQQSFFHVYEDPTLPGPDPNIVPALALALTLTSHPSSCLHTWL